MSKIEQITFDAELSKFSSMRIILERLANTIPYIVFEISQIIQVTRAMYEKGHNQILQALKQGNQIST